MATKETYRLFGYIEYITSSIGFVTPVFRDQLNSYYIQVSSDVPQKTAWETLPDEYHSSIVPAKVNRSILLDSFIYGFKWDAFLKFAKGNDMVEYLSQSFLPEAQDGHELAKSFIEDWNLISSQASKGHNDHSPLSFLNKKNSVIKSSFITEAEVNQFQEFDNFLSRYSNREAYRQALNFIKDKSLPIIIIQGRTGSGKTHFINAIAKQFISDNRNNKVGLFKIFEPNTREYEISEAEILQFEILASVNDIIIIENIENLLDKIAMLKLTTILKKWGEEGKKIVISFNGVSNSNLMSKSMMNSEFLILEMSNDGNTNIN